MRTTTLLITMTLVLLGVGRAGRLQAADGNPAIAGPQRTQPAQGAALPTCLDLNAIQAGGPLHAMAKLAYARQLKGHGGSDWNHKKIPGDGTGRWILAMCRLGAYLHEKPKPMLDEIPRMMKMRNTYGVFGPDYGPTVIVGGAWFDHNHVLEWAIDYARYYDRTFGMGFVTKFADASFMAREPYLRPAPRQPGSHWQSWGETGADFGPIQGMARLAMATGEEKYKRFVKALADVGMEFSYRNGHGHATALVMDGYVLACEATGERKYLDFAANLADTIALRSESTHMALPDYLGKTAHTEGCGVVDWLRLNLDLGRATGKALYFDRAERILWGPYFYQMNNRGGMRCGSFSLSMLAQALGEDIGWCCSMHGPNALMSVFGHTVLTDKDGLIVPLVHPFTAKAKLRAGKGVDLSMATTYPDDGAVRLRVDRSEAVAPWRLRLRVPAWSRIEDLRINGKPESAQAGDGWLDLTRDWKAGDEIAFRIPLTIWFSRPQSDGAIRLPDAAGRDAILKSVRVFRGPMLLNIEQSFNAALNWANIKQRPGTATGMKWEQYETPLTLFLPAKDGLEKALPQDESANPKMFLAPFVYPSAHLKVQAGPTPAMDARGEPTEGPALVRAKAGAARLRPAVLMPIAEKLAHKEGLRVILFDVVLLRTQEGLRLIQEKKADP